MSAPADGFWSAVPFGPGVRRVALDANGLAALDKPEGVLSHPNGPRDEARSLVVAHYDAAVQTFLPYFAAGRKGRPKAVLKRLSDSTEEALVGGMVSLISRRIVAGQTEELESLLPDLTEFTLAPYVGNDEAARIARG